MVIMPLLSCNHGVAGSITCSGLSGDTLNRGPMAIFEDKLITLTYSDKTGDYAVQNVLSPRDTVFRPQLSDINLTSIMT